MNAAPSFYPNKKSNSTGKSSIFYDALFGALVYTRPQGVKTCIEKWVKRVLDLVVFFGKYFVKAENCHNYDERPGNYEKKPPVKVHKGLLLSAILTKIASTTNKTKRPIRVPSMKGIFDAATPFVIMISIPC